MRQIEHSGWRAQLQKRKELSVAVMNFDKMSRYLEITPNARMLLERPEKEISMRLSTRVEAERLIVADTYVVYYNTARGVAKGGVRMAADVTLSEVGELAELMVWKTALTRIPFGGGKSGIRIDPHGLSDFDKREVIREFVHILKEELLAGNYVPAPDMGTSPREMAIIFGELHIPQCVTGKPPRVGGLPGRREATGRGVATCAKLAVEKCLHKKMKDCSVAIQGFGNVGLHTAQFLHQSGAKLVAASNSQEGILKREGLPVPELVEHYQKHRFEGFDAERITNEELLTLDVDILIPAASGRVITGENADAVKAKLILEGANGPSTPEADEILRKRGIPVIPDILANSGGVIASYIEWRNAKSGSTTLAEETYEFIDTLVGRSFEAMMQTTAEHELAHRDAAMLLALAEVLQAMRDRSWI
jgi:glutamate dehydrogenase (NAD(P)+)